MNNNLTEKFVDEIYSLSQAGFPETVVLQAKGCILDYLGVTLAGARSIEEKAYKLIDCFGPSRDGVSVIGFKRKTNIQGAAFINGISAHVLELDDGVRFGNIHPGATVISALFPLAELEKIKGQRFLSGVIAGYEASVRVARALQPSHKEKGYHATGTCGTIGSAMGVAVALGFTKQQMKDALSAAAAGASGILAIIEDGSELKPFNAGQGALGGLMAAYMARAGFKGPRDVLGGDRGFISMMAGQYDLSLLGGKVGDSYSIEKAYKKPYAACRHCHPAIEAALSIRSNHGIHPEEIRSVKVSTYGLAVRGHDHREIKGINSAKMSIPYSVAAALVSGKAGMEEYTLKMLTDPRVISLTQKVKIYARDSLTALVPLKRPAVVEITTRDYKHYTERVDLAKGEPENPLSGEEIKEKFTSLALYGGKSRQEASEIMRHAWNIESGLANLLALL